MTHRHTVRIYYEDTDAGAAVYHARYLAFAERARTEALREAGIPHAEMVAEHGVMFMVRRVEVDYLRPARLDDSLLVETETLAVGGATTTLRQTMHGPNGPCAVVLVHLACVRLDNGKPGRIPPRWRTTLAALRQTDGSLAGGSDS